jgi:hypothetical protein
MDSEIHTEITDLIFNPALQRKFDQLCSTEREKNERIWRILLRENFLTRKGRFAGMYMYR